MEEDLLPLFARTIGIRCPACADCRDGQDCKVTDNCPMTWCACHRFPEDD